MATESDYQLQFLNQLAKWYLRDGFVVMGISTEVMTRWQKTVQVLGELGKMAKVEWDLVSIAKGMSNGNPQSYRKAAEIFIDNLHLSEGGESPISANTDKLYSCIREKAQEIVKNSDLVGFRSGGKWGPQGAMIAAVYADGLSVESAWQKIILLGKLEGNLPAHFGMHAMFNTELYPLMLYFDHRNYEKCVPELLARNQNKGPRTGFVDVQQATVTWREVSFMWWASHAFNFYPFLDKDWRPSGIFNNRDLQEVLRAIPSPTSG